MHKGFAPWGRNINGFSIAISAFVLAACLAITIYATFLSPYSGIVLNGEWIVQWVEDCDPQEPSCAANRNAIQPGDQILSIQGLTREEYQRSSSIFPFQGSRPGDSVPISFARDGREGTVEWVVPSRSVFELNDIFSQAVIYTPFWLAGTAILLLMQPRDRRWRLLILFNYATALYLAIGTNQPLLPVQALDSLSWLLVPIYLHLHLIIPSDLVSLKLRKSVPLGYLAGILLSVLGFFNLLPGRFYILALFISITGSLGLLSYRLFTETKPSERLALRMMLIGISMALGPGMILMILPAAIARVPSSAVLLFVWLAIPLLPFFYMYAIYRRRLGGFEFRANRALNLYIFSLLYALAIVVVFSVASRSLYLQDQSLYASLVVTLIFVILAPPLRARFQRWFDSAVYGVHHDPQEIVREFALQLPAAFEPALLVRLLSREVAPSLMIRESALYQKTEGGFTLFYKEGIEIPETPAESSELERWIRRSEQYRPPESGLESRFAWVRLSIALRSGGKTIGVWLFGRRDPDDFYPQKDILLLRTLGSQVAPMLENLRLYEETQRRLERLQTLRDIDITISSSLDLHFTLEILLDQVSRRSNVDAVDVLLLNAKTTMLEFVAGKGFHSDALHHTHLRLGEGYAGQAAHERRLVFIENLDAEVGSLARSPKFPIERFKSYCAAPLIVKGQVKGVLEVFFRTSLAPDPDWFDFLESLTVQAAIAIDNASLFDELQHSNAELNLAYDTTIEGWSRALDLRDEGTEGHTERVTEMTERLARAMGVDESQMVHIRRGALLHDMGKMGIPDSILLKRDALTREEWDIMRRHPLYAFEMLAPVIYLRNSLDIPYCHHEKWDGTGYPRGLKGEQIPLAARIFAIVDVWDATTSDRPYRQAWTKEQAREFLRTQSGKHFDPQIVPVFLSIVD
ncbi:MAG: GAF domain-containing protein [Anaerolineales bacterium]|nr:GAF domain-containing protein [Anaerolineales bacterium]